MGKQLETRSLRLWILTVILFRYRVIQAPFQTTELTNDKFMVKNSIFDAVAIRYMGIFKLYFDF